MSLAIRDLRLAGGGGGGVPSHLQCPERMPHTPQMQVLRTSPHGPHPKPDTFGWCLRDRGRLWWDPRRTFYSSNSGRCIRARACGHSAQVRRGQERARSSQRALVPLKACGVLALQRSTSTQSSLSPPVQSERARAAGFTCSSPP